MAAKVGIISLGCPRNLVDSENILGILRERNHQICDDIESSEVVIINTCSFIEAAKQESIDTIFELVELKKQGGIKKIIVAGCLSERYSKELARQLKDVDAFIGTPHSLYNHHTPREFITPPHYAYVKIAEGCDNRCTYCMISKLRGTYKSRPIESIQEEVKELCRNGVREINLIGQDTTFYGNDLYGSPKLADLLRVLSGNLPKHNGNTWLRLLYTHPAHYTDALIEAIRDEPAICKYIDLPLQHINDRVLRRMGRGIKKQELISLIEKLRKEIPDLFIRTSIIIGFPGETDEEFEELMRFVGEQKFERLGAFIYSREEGTAAFDFPAQVPEKVKKRRFQELMSLQQDVSREINKSFLGKEVEVLIDEETEAGLFIGRTKGDAPEVDGEVHLRSKNRLSPGEFVATRIVDTYEYDLVGEEI